MALHIHVSYRSVRPTVHLRNSNKVTTFDSGKILHQQCITYWQRKMPNFS